MLGKGEGGWRLRGGREGVGGGGVGRYLGTYGLLILARGHEREERKGKEKRGRKDKGRIYRK